jgi:hypothetical protein
MENFITKTARLAREEEGKKFRLPGKSGARVFHWLEVDGFLLRMEVYRREVDDLWHDFPDQQKCYNAFNREWDICEQFAPTAIVEDEGFDDDGDPNIPYSLLEQDDQLDPPTFTGKNAPAP